MSKGKAKGFREDENDTLWFEDRVYVPNNADIRKLILQEAHDSPYSIHPGNTKMYLDLKERFLVDWYEERHCRVCSSM